MPYSSYNAYIVQNNLYVIFSIVAANQLATVFNIRPLLFLFNWIYFKVAEFLLICACCYNIYTVTSDIFTPYISRIHIPYSEYFLTPGPLVTAMLKFYCFLFKGFGTQKNEAVPALTTPAKPIDGMDINSVFSRFLSMNNNSKRTVFDNVVTTSNNTIASTSQQSPLSTDNKIPANTTTNTNNSTTINNNIVTSAIQQKNDITAKGTTNVQPAYAIKLNTNSFAPTPSIFGNTIPKLKYTPCIQPPLEPSAHRERILWYLQPTPEVVEDFRIEQVIGFQKYWHKFNDRYSRNYYDKLTTALLKYIFTPLANSIDTFNKKLAPRQSIATCSPETVALSYLMPEFNSDSIFTISEVLKFLTLESHGSPESIQYVSERVKELAANRKMAAYTYHPKSSGMPTDSQIIMHILKNYLILKEPYAIPPLVPEEIDLFKFLLIYVYMTPELEHWKVFSK